MKLFDFALAGRRIRLISTDDPYTKLKSGDMGTIKYIFDNLDETCIAIEEWDSIYAIAGRGKG